MRRFAFLIGALVVGVGGLSQKSSAGSNWSRAAKAARRYVTAPGCENAAAILREIPDRELKGSELPDQATSELLYGRLTLLEARMFEGDECAARLAFRLRRVADGAFAEDLGAALGALATTRPELFLRELARAKAGVEVVSEFSSDVSEAETRRERARRLESLRRVRIPELESWRRRALGRLERGEP